MDINMPIMDGKQTLGKIRQTEGLTQVPVVMFSTAANLMDKLFFDRHDAHLFTKPSSLKAMDEQIEKILVHCATTL
jgi:CheY-like chemotaxis protein